MKVLLITARSAHVLAPSPITSYIKAVLIRMRKVSSRALRSRQGNEGEHSSSINNLSYDIVMHWLDHGTLFRKTRPISSNQTQVA